MENPAHRFRKTNLELQLIYESQTKTKTVMSWSSRKKSKGIFVFFLPFILSEGIFFFSTFVFYFNVQCIEYTFKIYILLHIKKRYFKIVESLLMSP